MINLFFPFYQPQTGYGTSYQSYQSFQGYRPPATYPTYVPSQGTSSTTSYSNSQAVTTSSSSVDNVSYPNYQTGYQMKQEQTNTLPQTGSYAQTTPVSYPQVQTVSYPQTCQQSYSYPQTAGYKGNTYQAGSYNQTSDVTPQQQRVIQQFVHQKTYGGHARNAIKKPKYQSSEEFYCDVCKIACGSPFVSVIMCTVYVCYSTCNYTCGSLFVSIIMCIMCTCTIVHVHIIHVDHHL